MVIHTPDHRLRVFVSSTLKELAEERIAVRQSIMKLRLAPVMFESGARPHPAKELYQSYLSQSQIFVGIYWQSYGWVAPDMTISGLEDEYRLSASIPRLIYIKNPAPDREPALKDMLDRIKNDNSSCYTYFSTPEELAELVQNDLALLLTEQFEAAQRDKLLSREPSMLPPTNVPVPRNPIIGREHELTTACDLLRRDDIALVTLTGVGGTGKSRLAIQIGLEMLDHFEDGVYLVRLEPITDPELVISTIAEAVGIREVNRSRPIAELLKDFLSDKNMLLLLDNFEQVVEAAPQLAGLLEACPRLKAVATSRTPLRLRAEKELPVPPLAVPSLEKSTEVYQLSQYAAVQLFIQRAQAAKPDFSITNANAAAVAEICYRLDGLPLAIELAAARIRMLTSHELLSRLDNRLDLLRGGTRDLPERQRTLRGTIDWSYNLLSEAEKKLFRRLSIFVDGWTLEAAEKVCDLDDELALRLDDVLASLIDNNLVIQAQSFEEQSHYGMLATIHEYAYERLVESDELEAIHCRHAHYFGDFVKMVEPKIRSVERVYWHQVMLNEFGNIRSALDWICESGNCVDIGQQIINDLGILWVTSGFSLEGGQWCAQIISLSDESTPITTRARLFSVAGWISWALGESSSPQENVDKSLELFQELEVNTTDDKRAYSLALIFKGMLAYASRDAAIATAMFQKSIELSGEIKDTWLKALALSMLGDIASFENDWDRAGALHNQSIRLARQQGDPWCLISPLMSSGQDAFMDGNFEEARSKFVEVEGILRKTGDRWSLSSALNDLGHIELMTGELDQARAYLLEALTLANMWGNRRMLLIILTGIAVIIARHAEKFPDNQPQFHDALTLAGRLCGATEAYTHIPGMFVWADSKILYEMDIAQVQSLMDEEAWNKAYFEGQNISLEEAISVAIQTLKGS